MADIKLLLDTHARLKPFKHQVVGVETMVQNKYFFLTDDMGLGKSKQAIDTAQVWFHAGVIDRVIVLCPSGVRSVWFDSELGEIAEHVWKATNAQVSQFRNKIRIWKAHSDVGGPVLKWVITNYEFIRNKQKLATLLGIVNKKTLLICDEASALKSIKSLQTKAAYKLRKKCGRVILLNGTPVTQGMGDVFSQARMMDLEILGYKRASQFRAAHAVMGGWQNREVVEWRDIDVVQEKMAPYVLRRLKDDCLDLPQKLPPVLVTAELSTATWKIYKQMRDELIHWVSHNHAAMAPQAAVKAMRLSQITSGFLGGIRELDLDSGLPLEVEEFANPARLVRIGTEKQDAVLDWIANRIEENPSFKMVLWSRFTVVIRDYVEALRQRFKQMDVGVIVGGQKESERDEAKRLLDPRVMPSGPVVVVGNPLAGGVGLQLMGANYMMYESNDYNLKTRLQSEDRIYRIGQTKPCHYFDVVAVGPNGQKTIDFGVLLKLRKKEDFATMVTSAWLSMVKEE